MSRPIVFHILFSSESLLPKQLKPPGDGSGTEVWIVIGWSVSHQTAGPIKGLLTQTSTVSLHFPQSWFSSDSSFPKQEVLTKDKKYQIHEG